MRGPRAAWELGQKKQLGGDLGGWVPERYSGVQGARGLMWSIRVHEELKEQEAFRGDRSACGGQGAGGLLWRLTGECMQAVEGEAL